MKKVILLSAILCCFYAQASTVRASTFGYSTTNATNALRNAILSQNDTIIVDLQSANWNIGRISLTDVRNKVIIFEKGVKLKAIPGIFAVFESLLRFNKCSNIKLIGYQAEFIMNKAEYAELKDGEFRHCLSIENSVNVSVYGLTFRDSGGDGIYIGGDNSNGGAGFCDTIFIEDVKCINNYRQGMSIISVKNMTVKNSEFSGTIGTLPEAGIDVEPNESYQQVVNLKIENCSFKNNGSSGFLLALINLKSNSKPISINVKDCYFENNCRPGNEYVKTEIFVGASQKNPVGGTLNFERCFINSSNYSAYYSRKTINAFSVKFKDCVFQNVSKLQKEFNEPIFLETPSYSNSTDKLGGYVFENVLLTYKTNFNFLRVYGAPTLGGLSNISGNITVVQPNNNSFLYTDVPSVDSSVNYTFSTQTSLPSTQITINKVADIAYECDGTPLAFKMVRSSSRTNYPLGVNYSKVGNVVFGDDVRLLTGGIVIPTNSTSSNTENVFARKDLVTEQDEYISIGILSNPLYSVGSPIANFGVRDCANGTSRIGLESKSGIDDIQIYPNPVSTFLNIDNLQENSNIEIINSLGQKVFSENKKIKSIDFSNFNSGLYFLKIENSTYRIIKK